MDHIEVPPESRSQGIGTRLMGQVKAYCDRTGKFLLVTHVTNFPFFQQLGWLHFQPPNQFVYAPHQKGLGIISSWLREARVASPPWYQDVGNPPGLPRPLDQAPDESIRPVPWSQGERGWGKIDGDRSELSREFAACLVCGEPVTEGKVVFIPQEFEENRPSLSSPMEQGISPPPVFELEDLNMGDWIVDHGPMHDRCAALTAAHCQTIKQGLASGKYEMGLYRSEVPDMPRQITSKETTCPTCGDPLQGEFGAYCPRCQWSEHDVNLDHDPLSNPPDPTKDLHRGIQANWEDDIDRIPDVKRIVPIPNYEINYHPGDRVTREYANPGPRADLGLSGKGDIDANTGTVIRRRGPGRHWVYRGDQTDYGHGTGNGFPVDHPGSSYDVQWDYKNDDNTFTRFSEPGNVGEAIAEHQLWPEGHSNALKGLISPQAPEAPPEHWARTIPSHRHEKWYQAVEDFDKLATMDESEAENAFNRAQQSVERWVSQGKVMPFAKHDPITQKAITQYMAVDGEAWPYPGEEPDLGRVLPEYRKRFGNEPFGIVHVPAQELLSAINSHPEYGPNWPKTFGEWENTYVQKDLEPRGVPKGSQETWPVILDRDHGDVLQDGWHRIHHYFANGVDPIPAIFYPR